MQLNNDAISALLHIQHVDMDARQVAKKLEELPQRQAILDARTKRRGVEQKAAQVAQMRAKVEERMAKLGAEDAQLADKERKVQADIDAAGGDFRNLEARTKELAGFAKRREALSHEREGLRAELGKIEAVEGQVSRALAALEQAEAAATEEFVREGGALKQRMSDLSAERAQWAGKVPADALAEFEKTAKRTGGVGIAVLSEGRCGACRSTLEPARVVDMRARGTVGTCPHCSRLLVL